ncbi:MAG: fimbrillin family protein [Bacteroidales bacterium]|nr:fimbrillin family protein [Bacteroidales bacterium]
MKKFFMVLAGAALMFAACSKTEVKNAQNNVIGFQPANQVATKVTGSVFPTTETFGTYAWTVGTTGEFFIENDEVAFDAASSVWTTATPYYWPKNQSVDFFSYYPYNASGAVPAVTANQISYTNVDFSATQVDIMYADKAVGYTDNANQVEDGQNAYEGVPTIFRHAGSKVKINVILGENEKTEGDGTITKWEVTLKSVLLYGLYIKGSCVMNLSDASATGIVPWTKPQDADGNYVWAVDNTLTNATDNSLYNDVQVRNLVKNVGQTVIPETYMLPQALVAGQQKIRLTFDVVTYRKAPGAADFVQYLTQTDIVADADLLIDTGNLNTSILAWQMNQNIVYNITIGPAGKQITFDPAIDNWENKTVATNIELVI